MSLFGFLHKQDEYSDIYDSDAQEDDELFRAL